MDGFFNYFSDPKTVTLVLQLYSIGNVLSCFVAAYGAYTVRSLAILNYPYLTHNFFQLKKNFVIPLAIFEFLYIVEIATLATLFLRILRHFVFLIHLILLTISATSYISPYTNTVYLASVKYSLHLFCSSCGI